MFVLHVHVTRGSCSTHLDDMDEVVISDLPGNAGGGWPKGWRSKLMT